MDRPESARPTPVATSPIPAPPATADPVPGLQPVAEDRTELRRGVLAIVAIAVVLLVVAVLSSQLGNRDDSAEPARQPVGTAPASPTTGGGASEEPPSGSTPPATSRPAVVVPVGLSTSAALLGSDSLEVVEYVRWPEGGPRTIRLELSPGALERAGLALDLVPQVEALQVSLDADPRVPQPVAGEVNAWLVTSSSGQPPTLLEVRYVLRGAIARSAPAAPGRALAVLAPLTAGIVADLPVRIMLPLDGVLNVFCPGAQRQELLCGRRDGDEWVVDPPPGAPLVVAAQVDLPPPV